MTHPRTETISSDERPEPVPVDRGPRRVGGPGARLTALTAALSTVLAGGVVTAAYRSFHSGSAAASLVPSTAFAFATVDLGLPGGQADALSAFAGHFPGSPTRTGNGSAVDRILRSMFRGSGNPHLDYDQDIKPWLGDNVAVAGWLDHAGDPQLEVLLQSRDDTAARTQLDKLMSAGGGGGIAFSDGYAVVASSAAEAQATVTAAKNSSLDGNTTFTHDVGTLPAGEAAIGWVDGAGAGRALQRALGSGAGTAMGPSGPFLFGFGGGLSGLTGRYAAGLHVSDGYAQLDVTSIGGTAAGATRSTLLTDLPAGTIAAVEIGGPGSTIDGVTGFLRGIGGLFLGGSGMSSCASGIAVPAVPALQVGPGAPHRRAILRQLRRSHRALRRQLQRQQNNVGPCQDIITRPPDPIAAFTKATGLTLPGDVKTLLGDGGVLAFGGLELGALPDVAIRSHPADLGAARDLGGVLKQTLAGSSGVDITVDTAGSDLVLATSSTYANQIAQNGGLGDQDQAATALGGIPDQVTAAGYVDFSRIWPLVAGSGGGVPDGVLHLKALGFWSDISGNVQHFQLRVVAG